LARITEDQLQFTPDMKKLFALTMLISFAMFCSCQKQGSAAERQLAQWKAQLDAREKALDEREKELALRETVLKERERGLAKNEKAAGNARTIQDPAQVQAERERIRQQLPAQWDADKDKRIQQLPAEVQALIPDPAKVQAQRERIRQRRPAERQRASAQGIRPSLAAPADAGAASLPQLTPLSVYPQPEATSSPSLAASPEAGATSPSPSPTPQ
jgi:hypothetical protein